MDWEVFDPIQLIVPAATSIAVSWELVRLLLV